MAENPGGEALYGVRAEREPGSVDLRTAADPETTTDPQPPLDDRGEPGALTPKGERTKSRIVEAALSLVTEVGYEEASMRAIARRAEVSVGNAYYYFPSKAHLVLAFYQRTAEQLRAAAVPILARERTLEARLRGVLWAWFKIIDPYHAASGALFQAAADPSSPLNPFSADSSEVRTQSIALYQAVVEGGSSHVPDDLRAELPSLLWTAHMGVALFWIHDQSGGRARTCALIDRAPSLLVRIIALSRIPGMADLRRQVRDLVAGLGATAPADRGAFRR